LHFKALRKIFRSVVKRFYSVNMPRVKSVKSLTEICIDFIIESQNLFSEKLPLGVLEDCVDALDSDKPAINPFDELRKLLQTLLQIYHKFLDFYRLIDC
jgi:hypothetical protein